MAELIQKGVIEKLAFHGNGILRNPGKPVIFVPFTAPLDEIECRITKIKKNYSEATLEKLIKPSPLRVKPLCPYFEKCGGCQLQHLAYPAQVDYKRQSVQDALMRVYKDTPITSQPADKIWAYRRHVTFTIQGNKLGYIAIDHKSLIEIKQCPIFITDGDPLLENLSNLVGKLEIQSDHSRLRVIKSDLGYILLFHFKQMPSNFREIFKVGGSLIGIIASSKKEEIRLGQTELFIHVDRFRLKTDPFAFVQNNQEQSDLIYQEIKKIINQEMPSHVLDLYAGIGITSLILSDSIKEIDAVELNAKAVHFAKINAAQYRIQNIHFHQGSVESILPKLLKKDPSLAVVNPPREGLSREVTKKLSESKLKKIIYISCQPATLARDLAAFKKAGFSLERASAFDMFPMTGHVETLAVLTRSCA